MRKTRLVILPTKCLHQMGFLLLFLSCPVIGDWGRIRPESENSHNAIQIEREGTCGLERDHAGELLGFFDDNGSKQCRLSKESDTSTPPRVGQITYRRSNEIRRIDQQRTTRTSERREERDVRRTTQRRITDERRDVRRTTRSRSLETRRTTNNDIRLRSQSVSNERVGTRNRDIQQDNSRRNQRLNLSRRTLERQNERMIEPTENRAMRTANDRRETMRRTVERDSTPEVSRRRNTERLSLARRQITETRRSSDRRIPEIRQIQTERREIDNRREVDSRRIISSAKESERRLDLDSRRFSPIEYRKTEENLSSKWMDLTGTETFKTGDWTANCVIGAVVYFLTTRQQVKAV